MSEFRKVELANVAAIILLPCVFILHNFNYYGELLFYKGSLFFLLYLLIPFIFWLLLKKCFHPSSTVATLLTIIASFFFLFFGTLQDFLLQNQLTHYVGKTIVLIGAFTLGFSLLWVKRPEANIVLKFFRLVIFTFLLTEIVLLFVNFNNINQTPKLAEQVSLDESRQAAGDSFNIYHIIFDGYTNSRTLQEEFSFHNPLDSLLKEKGFFVAGRSKSNYNFTPYSIASTLNFQYLNVDGKQLERNYKNFFWGNLLYESNAVFQLFKAKMYTLETYSILEDYSHLDQLGTFVPITPVLAIRNQTAERIFLNPWLLHRLKGGKAGTLPKKIKNNLSYYEQYNHNALENILGSPGKSRVYNFTHFLLPHEPYRYLKKSIDSLSEADIMNHQEGYINQVKYVNTIIEKIVTELQKNRNNIIIIQGDHGFRNYDFSKTPALKQFETFNSFYFPDHNYSKLNDSISLVNTYRYLLNQYFKQNLPYLKDQIFYSN